MSQKWLSPGASGNARRARDSITAAIGPSNSAPDLAIQGDDQLVEVIRCNSHRELRIMLRDGRLLVLEQWLQCDETGLFKRRGSIPIRVDLLADVIGAMATGRTALLREGERNG